MSDSKETIFGTCGLKRSVVKWEDRLMEATPCEKPDKIYFKREDKFAPMGYGGINGSKLRQLVYLLDRHKKEGGGGGVLTACSVLSPQSSMASLAAKHFELPCTIMFGATKPTTAVRHPNVAIACEAGADFRYHSVGYNPVLQGKARSLRKNEEFKDWYFLHYGITTPDGCSDGDIEAFHRVGAEQVKNLPAEVKTLVVCAGSCNSCTSILYGIALYPPASLERVFLLGVGPTRLDFIEKRLHAIERASGVAIRSLFRRKYHQHPAMEEEHQQEKGKYLIEHVDLHKMKWVTYQDKKPFSMDGIEFHPTYEGKAMSYMAEHQQEYKWFWEPKEEGSILFWIIGSEPTGEPMDRHGLGKS